MKYAVLTLIFWSEFNVGLTFISFNNYTGQKKIKQVNITKRQIFGRLYA